MQAEFPIVPGKLAQLRKILFFSPVADNITVVHITLVMLLMLFTTLYAHL